MPNCAESEMEESMQRVITWQGWGGLHVTRGLFRATKGEGPTCDGNAAYFLVAEKNKLSELCVAATVLV